MEENIDILIQKIQEVRNPKYFLWQIVREIEWFSSEEYKIWLVGKKDEYIYFNYDTKNHTLYYDFYKIYQILSLKYHLNNLEANNLVSDMVGEQFKMKVNTTSCCCSFVLYLVGEQFKMKVNTNINNALHNFNHW
jgi:hypothetical protein